MYRKNNNVFAVTLTNCFYNLAFKTLFWSQIEIPLARIHLAIWNGFGLKIAHLLAWKRPNNMHLELQIVIYCIYIRELLLFWINTIYIYAISGRNVIHKNEKNEWRIILCFNLRTRSLTISFKAKRLTNTNNANELVSQQLFSSIHLFFFRLVTEVNT